MFSQLTASVHKELQLQRSFFDSVPDLTLLTKMILSEMCCVCMCVCVCVCVCVCLKIFYKKRIDGKSKTKIKQKHPSDLSNANS